jgi:hypothetical protein
MYESVIDFIMGRNVIYGNVLLMMAFKMMTMAICWGGCDSCGAAWSHLPVFLSQQAMKTAQFGLPHHGLPVDGTGRPARVPFVPQM